VPPIQRVPPPQGLSTAEVLDTLDASDALELDEPGPWPEDPDEEAWALADIDWTAVEGDDRDALVADDAGGWYDVVETIVPPPGSQPRVPPRDVFDALAWYCPIHFYGPKWGIYIREQAVLDLAGDLLTWSSRVSVAGLTWSEGQ